MTVYVASGWFTEEQEKARLRIITVLEELNMDYFNPRCDTHKIHPDPSPQIIFDNNIRNIDSCDVVVASTIGKDMGTLFECGYAFSIKKPIIYLWESSLPLNLMLSQSAHYVARLKDDLLDHLQISRAAGAILRSDFKGEIE